MDKFELAISLLVIAVGSFIMGAAAVGIQLEKIKRQRDEAISTKQEYAKEKALKVIEACYVLAGRRYGKTQATETINKIFKEVQDGEAN